MEFAVIVETVCLSAERAIWSAASFVPDWSVEGLVS